MKRFENKKSSSSETISGCGPDPGFAPVNLNISTTTGGNFSVLVDVQNSVENLKKIIAKKLKVSKDRICLLHRERELQEGSLRENGLVDGAKIILIPNVETGLLAQRPENTVMQALESLNDAQVNDFLSGKTPLNLSMRLGDHMMLIQLQLSTISPSNPRNQSRSRTRSGRSSISSASSSCNGVSCSSFDSGVDDGSRNLQSTAINKTISLLEHQENMSQDISTSFSNSHHQDTSSSINSIPDGELDSFLNRHGFDSINDIVKNFSFTQAEFLNNEKPSLKSSYEAKTTAVSNCCSSGLTNMSTIIDQSPIKSLSNLVSSPLKSGTIKNIQIKNADSNTRFIGNINTASHMERTSMCPDPISAKLTSCLCKRLDGTNASSTTDTVTTDEECKTNQCQLKHEVVSTDIVTEPIMHIAKHQLITNSSTANTLNSPKPLSIYSSSSSSLLYHKTVNNSIEKSKHCSHPSLCNVFKKNFPTFSKDSLLSSSSKCDSGEIALDEITRSCVTATNARALTEASRNLTQTLRKLSKEVFTNKVGLSDQTSQKNNSGAVIESMKNHGKGIYSGTFSGTLNPALQDRYGRPKRDISTVIHILNDLLSATPQCNRNTRINYESSTLMSSRRGLNKQSFKHNFSASERERNKYANRSKSNNVACIYGECNGHSSSSVASSLLSTSNAASVADSHRYNISVNNCQDTFSSLGASISNKGLFSDLNLSLSDERYLCKCNNSYQNLQELTSNNATTNDITRMCTKCSIDLENSKTKCKLDQLRLVMKQKKQKREARKLKGTPYAARMLNTQHNKNPSNADGGLSFGAGNTLGQAGNGNSGCGTTSSTGTNTITSITPPSEVSPKHIVEEVDTAA